MQGSFDAEFMNYEMEMNGIIDETRIETGMIAMWVFIHGYEYINDCSLFNPFFFFKSSVILSDQNCLRAFKFCTIHKELLFAKF